MDELKEAWKNLKSETSDFTTMEMQELQSIIHDRSKGPIGKLYRQVLIKWYLSLGFTAIIAVGIPFVQVVVSQILLLILLAAYIVGDILLYKEAQKLKEGVDLSKNLKEGLNAYYKRVKDVLKYEELIGLTLYPVSLAAGFFIGMKLGAPDEEIMNETSDWIALVIAMIVITPLSDWFARWLNKVAFGKYLNQLKKNIDELDNL